MKIKAKIDRMVNSGNVKAIASVSLDGMFVVKNLKIMDGRKGLFVSMPQETFPGKDGQKKYSKLYRMDLPHRAISVYVYLSDRANKDGICWPSIPTISKDLHLSESTTRRAIRDLQKAGVIQTEQRHRENGGNSSLRYLLMKIL